jgi:hypothetical protein
MGHTLPEDLMMAGGGGELMSLQRQLSVLSHSLVNNLPIRAEQLLALRNENEVSSSAPIVCYKVIFVILRN